jgi:hypothetical protein
MKLLNKKKQTQKKLNDLKWSYFEIEYKQDFLYNLKQYLEPDNKQLKQECKFERTWNSKDKVFGKNIIEWIDRTNKIGIANLKYNPNNKYQILIQFIGIEKPLKKGTSSRKFLEELLSVCNSDILFCGDIYPIGKNILIQYINNNFVLYSKENFNNNNKLKGLN